MKNNILFLALLFLVNLTFGQEDKIPKTDTTKIKLGSSTLIFIENDPNQENFECDAKKKDTSDVDLTLAFDLGVNGYSPEDFSTSLPAQYKLMELNYPRSRSVGFSFMVRGLDIIKNRLYISPGIGVNWNKYSFKNNINISTSNDSTAFTLDTIIEYDKFKLRATYLQIPVLLGVRIGKLEHPVSIQIGVVGSYKLNSIVKQKYDLQGTDYKNKVNDDFNINPFKFDLIARIAIDEIGIFARYSLTPLFEENKAPELYPFSAGITIGGFKSK